MHYSLYEGAKFVVVITDDTPLFSLRSFLRETGKRQNYALSLPRLQPPFQVFDNIMKYLTAASLVLLRSSSAFSNPSFTKSCYSTTKLMSKPFSVIVEAEIKPDRMDDFMSMIKTNAENSRKEPGCIRFGT